MTAPQGLRVISIGQLGTPEALGREIFERSRSGAYPVQPQQVVEPDLPPGRSLVDCTIMPEGCTLPANIDNPAQAAKDAVANGAHALTIALGANEAGVFGRAAEYYRDVWSKGSLLDNPAPAHAAAIGRCNDAFESAATQALGGGELSAEAANQLAVALTWALLNDDGQRFLGLAEQLQSSDALAEEVRADLTSAIGLLRQ